MREEMIRGCFSEEENLRIKFSPVRDYPYNVNLWISEVQNIVRNTQEEILADTGEIFTPATRKVALTKIKTALVGHYKDASSYYLKNFPQWKFIQNLSMVGAIRDEVRRHIIEVTTVDVSIMVLM